jgi:hypothetical protein
LTDRPFLGQVDSMLCAAGVRGLRCTGNAIERTAILAGGAPTHFENTALFPNIKRAVV